MLIYTYGHVSINGYFYIKFTRTRIILIKLFATWHVSIHI